MTRALYLDDEHERHLELAARYLRILGHLEYAHATAAPWKFEHILATVDPLDLKIVGQEIELLRSLYRTAPIRIAAGPRAATLANAVGPPPACRSDGAESPSPAVTLPKVQCR